MLSGLYQNLSAPTGSDSVGFRWEPRCVLTFTLCYDINLPNLSRTGRAGRRSAEAPASEVYARLPNLPRPTLTETRKGAGNAVRSGSKPVRSGGIIRQKNDADKLLSAPFQPCYKTKGLLI